MARFLFVLIFSTGIATVSIGQTNFVTAGTRVESNSNIHGFPKNKYEIVINSDDSFDIAYEKIKNHIIDYGFKIKTSDKNKGTIITTSEQIKYWRFDAQLNVSLIKKGKSTKIEITGKVERNYFGELWDVVESTIPYSIKGVNGQLVEMMHELVLTYYRYEDEQALTIR